MSGRHINRLIFVLVGFGLVGLNTLSCAPQDPQPGELTRQQIDDLRSRAERGEVGAQYELGFMHWYGLGVTHDEAVAVDWYLRAATQGFAEAQFNLGFAYTDGRGVIEDVVAAARWYRQAAEQGHAEAMRWIRRTAEQGSSEAQFSLGECMALAEGFYRMGWRRCDGCISPRSRGM